MAGCILSSADLIWEKAILLVRFFVDL